MDDLKLAEKVLAETKDGSTSEFKSVEDFRLAIEEKIDSIEFGNEADLTEIWNWFTPGGPWDKFMGQGNIELKDQIFARVDRWKSHHLIQ